MSRRMYLSFSSCFLLLFMSRALSISYTVRQLYDFIYVLNLCLVMFFTFIKIHILYKCVVKRSNLFCWLYIKGQRVTAILIFVNLRKDWYYMYYTTSKTLKYKLFSQLCKLYRHCRYEILVITRCSLCANYHFER